MIRPDEKLFRLVERDPSLADVLAEAVPGLDKLRRAGVGRILGRVMTVERAARMAGLEPEELIRRLERAEATRSETGAVAAAPASHAGNERAHAPAQARGEAMADEAPAALPAALGAVPPELVIDVDVRETLRAGGEPFAEIMAARRRLPPGGVLRLRAIFEPVPLYFVLGGQGFDHWTEQLAEDDWRVWFFPASAGDTARAEASLTPGDVAAAGAGAAAPASAPEDDVVVLDVRGLEPPEPMVRTLAALEELAPGRTLVQLNVRVPRFLLPMLEDRGYSYEVREQGPTLVRTFIRRRTA